MSQQLKVIVTGANRGIGKAICESILKAESPAVKLYACSRSGADLGLHVNGSSKSSVVYEKLDIADRKSIADLTSTIDDAQERIDVLINNAGVNLEREASLDLARETFEINYFGTIRMCQNLIPHMTGTSRIVNVSSIASVLRLYHEQIRQRFRDAQTLPDLEKLADDYLSCVENGTEEASGFGLPGRSYNVSKALLNAATRILAKENPDIQINSCCPGWIATDMGELVLGGKPPKTPAQGAVIPLRLAFEDVGDISGQFWANSSVSSTEAGQVKKA